MRSASGDLGDGFIECHHRLPLADGAVDRVWSEGDTRRHAQTLSLGPAEGGFVELTLDREGAYPFVTHAFGDMVRGAIGALKTSGAPATKPAPEPPAADMHAGMADEGHEHAAGEGH